MKQPIKSALALSSAVVAVVGLVLAPVAADAASTTTVTAVLSGSASVSSTSTTVSLPITPTVSGSFTAAADTVVAGTNNPTGYKLQISGTPTALTKGPDSIAASAGTPASPITLVANTWGYHVDGQYGFTGTGAAVTNQASLAGTWAGVTGTAVDIKTVATATASDSTSVWFGAGATTAKPAGNYAAVVTYTAVTNP